MEKNSPLYPPLAQQQPVPLPTPGVSPPVVPEPQLAATAIGLNYAGYAAQAVKVAAAWRTARRVWTKGNADMSYAISKALHGATFRARPLVISHLFSAGAAPKVGVVSTSSAEQYAPDGQVITVTTPQWMNGYKTNIAGATGVDYTPVAGDVGKYLTVGMTPATAARPGIAFVSNQIGKVAA